MSSSLWPSVKKLTVRCDFTEISAHHRGHQPQVQGGRGGRRRRRARPAHQVHSQSGGNSPLLSRQLSTSEAEASV